MRTEDRRTCSSCGNEFSGAGLAKAVNEPNFQKLDRFETIALLGFFCIQRLAPKVRIDCIRLRRRTMVAFHKKFCVSPIIVGERILRNKIPENSGIGLALVPSARIAVGRSRRFTPAPWGIYGLVLGFSSPALPRIKAASVRLRSVMSRVELATASTMPSAAITGLKIYS
jgi:hypothetical protein